MKKRDLLLIEWNDTITQTGWEEADKVLDCHVNPCRSIGWRVKAPDRKHISISPMVDADNHCGDRQTFPRGCIKSIKKL